MVEVIFTDLMVRIRTVSQYVEAFIRLGERLHEKTAINMGFGPVLLYMSSFSSDGPHQWTYSLLFIINIKLECGIGLTYTFCSVCDSANCTEPAAYCISQSCSFESLSGMPNQF